MLLTSRLFWKHSRRIPWLSKLKYLDIDASAHGYTQVVALLLQDLSNNGNKANRMASNEGYTELVKLLLKDRRVDSSDEDNKAIKWVCRSVNSSIDDNYP